jgi:hypothetical protein
MKINQMAILSAGNFPLILLQELKEHTLPAFQDLTIQGNLNKRNLS